MRFPDTISLRYGWILRCILSISRSGQNILSQVRVEQQLLTNGFLLAHRQVSETPSIEQAWLLRRTFSMVLRDSDGSQAMKLYDSLSVNKGPRLGTNFTLACPSTILAHYTELCFAFQVLRCHRELYEELLNPLKTEIPANQKASASQRFHLHHSMIYR